MIRLFRVSIPVSVLLLVVSDAILISLCYVLAALFAFDPLTDPWFYFRYENGWLQLLLVVFVIQVGMYFMDLYDDLRLRSRALLLQQLAMMVGISFLIQALVGYSESQLLQLPQWTMIYGSGLVLVVIPGWRAIFFGWIRQNLPNERALFLGYSPLAKELIEAIKERPDLGYTLVGYLNSEPGSGTDYLGAFDKLKDVARSHQPTLLLMEHKQIRSLPMQEIVGLRAHGVRLKDTLQLYEMVFGRVSIQELDPAQLLFSEELRPGTWISRLQSAYSFFLALVGLIVFLPIILIVFVLVKLTSRGPALYRQQRVGLNQVPFYLYKFRSMYIDAEARTGPVWATQNDSRITPLGRWLRKLRFDEVPQFYNVLRGDMSLVGPRPERPEFCEVLAAKIPLYHQRHLVKPGITGWAQINHKYTDTVEDAATKLEYDLYYVKHLAPALDAYIIFHTIKVMLLFKGAQ